MSKNYEIGDKVTVKLASLNFSQMYAPEGFSLGYGPRDIAEIVEIDETSAASWITIRFAASAIVARYAPSDLRLAHSK